MSVVDAPLIQMDELAARLGLAGGFADADEQVKYATWLAGVSKAIKTYVKWDLSYHAADIEYYDGNGQQALVLRQPYVWADSTLAVYLDPTGAYGFGPSAFAAATLLTIGTNYAPKIEMRKDLAGTVTPLSKSGLLIRLQNVSNSLWWPSDLVFRPAQSGGLAWNQGPYWPPGVGNIKVVANWGFQAVPEDIKLAVVQFIGLIRTMSGRGFPITSESLGDYSYSGALQQWQELGTPRQLLSGYRDVQI